MLKDRYFPQEIEKKWQKHWADTQINKVYNESDKEKILCSFHVAIPIWKTTYGTR